MTPRSSTRTTGCISRSAPADRRGGLRRGRDLLRDDKGVALIGDSRDDENKVVASLHSLVQRFHNLQVDLIRSRQPDLLTTQVFEEARLQTQWHYQWAVLTDFLPVTVGQEMVDLVLPAIDIARSAPDLKFYQQRRAYATARRAWPELDVICAARRQDLADYISSIGDQDRVLDMLVGDTQRLWIYADQGYAEPQPRRPSHTRRLPTTRQRGVNQPPPTRNIKTRQPS
ncbi:MAG: peroxidase family protein [Dermatophilaceae bacterium]